MLHTHPHARPLSTTATPTNPTLSHDQLLGRYGDKRAQARLTRKYTFLAPGRREKSVFCNRHRFHHRPSLSSAAHFFTGVRPDRRTGPGEDGRPPRAGVDLVEALRVGVACCVGRKRERA